MVERVGRTEFTYARADLRHPDSGVARFKGDNIVWWSGAIRTPGKGSSIPRVNLTFRTLYNEIPGPFLSATVPLSSFPHYQHGTIWRNGQCISDTVQAIQDFTVDFSPGKWSLTSRAELASSNQSHIFSDSEYPLRWHNRDQCKLIRFPLSAEKVLLIPCTEFLIRNYLRNIQACRILTTQRWSEVNRSFYKSMARSEDNWRVEATSIMRKYDAVFLAHLLYDQYTERIVKKFNAQFTSKTPETLVFPEVEPWFTGTTEVRCKGRWLNDNKTFLCLSLMSYSQPKGRAIDWITPDFDSTNGIEDAGRLIMPTRIRTAEEDELVLEQSFIAPDSHSETLIVKAPPLVILGEEREVITKKKKVTGNKSEVGPLPPGADTFSDAGGTGSGKGTGKAEHTAEATLESKGFLRDVWNSLVALQKANPKLISQVNWFTLHQRFKKNDEIQLIQFPPIDDDHAPYEAKIWVHPNRDATKQRGLLVIRVKINGNNYFIFEIQRDTPLDKTKKATPYAGAFVKAPITLQQLETLVEEICITLPYKEGRFKHMISTFPKETKIFSHKDKSKTIIYQNRFINLFKEEIGITLKKLNQDHETTP